MPKQLLFDDNARSRLMRGIDKLADAVATTMGPTGRNVIIDKSFGGPVVTKDGVTVAKEIELEDRFENMGSKLVVEVAHVPLPEMVTLTIDEPLVPVTPIIKSALAVALQAPKSNNAPTSPFCIGLLEVRRRNVSVRRSPFVRPLTPFHLV